MAVVVELPVAVVDCGTAVEFSYCKIVLLSGRAVDVVAGRAVETEVLVAVVF
jgi:hypothetical protein